jgi:dihydroflavonol-4-reductase
MKKLVTGATGFIGSAIARELLKNGQDIKILARKTSNLENVKNLDAEIVYGDICDKESMKSALKGCDTLYFTAAKFAHWAPNPKELYEVNVGGTRATLGAAYESGIEKIVYTSTNNAIGASGPTPANEEMYFNYWEARDHYSMSKYIAENEARIFVTRGLPVVFVNPTLVIGINDIKPTPSGQMIIDTANEKMPGYIDGGVNIADVEDVARGHVLAAQKGRVGERYLLGNTNITVHDYLFLIAKLANVKPPKIELPYNIALLFGHLFEFGSSITKKIPTVTASEVRIGRMREWYDCSKAVKELGLTQTPIEETIGKAIEWFRKTGRIKNTNK